MDPTTISTYLFSEEPQLFAAGVCFLVCFLAPRLQATAKFFEDPRYQAYLALALTVLMTTGVSLSEGLPLKKVFAVAVGALLAGLSTTKAKTLPASVS